MFLCPSYLLYSTEVLLDIYQEYAEANSGLSKVSRRQNTVELGYEANPLVTIS